MKSYLKVLSPPSLTLSSHNHTHYNCWERKPVWVSPIKWSFSVFQSPSSEKKSSVQHICSGRHVCLTSMPLLRYWERPSDQQSLCLTDLNVPPWIRTLRSWVVTFYRTLLAPLWHSLQTQYFLPYCRDGLISPGVLRTNPVWKTCGMLWPFHGAIICIPPRLPFESALIQWFLFSQNAVLQTLLYNSRTFPPSLKEAVWAVALHRFFPLSFQHDKVACPST